jgi:hypothetical protein
MNIVATRTMADRPGGLPADWSRKRKALLIVFALMMTYLHSLYIVFFYVTDWDYWWPFWTGMTVEQRLLSYALALFTNFGLMAMPFVRAPGRLLRTLVAVSLGCGALISAAWLLRDLWVLGLPKLAPVSLSEGFAFFLIAVILEFLNIALRVLYATAILLNLWFLVKMTRPRQN